MATLDGLRALLRTEPPKPWRWQALADYNGRVAQGIIHTPEYVDRMRAEQEAFNRETYGPGAKQSAFPIILDGRR